MRRRSRAPLLEERVSALTTAVELGEGTVPPARLRPAREVLERAGARSALAPGVTVAALLGATGSGKSSLFNALVGEPLSAVHARRPTTTQPLAAVWDAPGATGLLDWLEVPDRRLRPTDPALSGLVLLDLPDIDSTRVENRAVAARLAERVDALVWVLDPQKYADAVVHEEYLRPLREHAAVSVVVLNQADRLPADELPGVLAHLRQVLADDGMGDVELLTTSARTGAGVPELRSRLARLAGEGRAARERLEADVRTVAGSLRDTAGGGSSAPDAGDLVDVCASAAGVREVVTAVERSYRRRAGRHVGWPPLRWLGRLRPDPLRRLHLESPAAGASSLPAPTPAQEAGVRTGVHDLAWGATEGMAEPWRGAVTQRTEDRVPVLVDALDTAVAGTDLGAEHRPSWWRLWSVLGLLLFTTALAGAAWLGALAVLGYLRLPEPETPMAGPLPWPTALLLGGLVAGLLLALAGRLLARVGARRAARRARGRLSAAVEGAATRVMVEPLRADLDRYREFSAAVELAAR
ncbi:GTPase [Oceanitalea stevensii]|uniref:50S ribosome-binding GTPase n=1 Tax=Oceanitalea stevensii TaxID=2763072 RepID=A0ABR8YZV2_9MICO|nr:GTPase [Oceanitalea stevensii]MBD8061246.1 50S ribosome-binding GTPase [Oceanitalea stevensii]